MNKYLLLRDNKQSGPYTVQELISKGIKAYDLVWLEGKSAAWRYPSEVEELKAFAPVVEEQPFDRFYKRPEPVSRPASESEPDNSRYAPKPAEKSETPLPASGKVYVNFPASQKSISEKKPVIMQEEKSAGTSFTAPLNKTAATDTQFETQAGRKKNHYFKYMPVAACLLLVSLISYLVINYNNQRKNIDQLNALVQRLAEKDRAQKSIAIPAAAVQEEIAVAEPHAGPDHSQEITDEKPVTPTVKPVNSSVEKPRSGVSEKENIVFKETKTTPAAGTTTTSVQPEQGSESDNSVPHENLFKLVSVKANEYKTGVLGGISNLQLELTNNSLHELHKVAVEVKYLGPEKKVVRTQTVYFENVEPGAQTTLDVPRSNRGVSIDYTITDIKS